MNQLTVWRWPDSGIRLGPSEPLLIVAVDTPKTAIRDSARLQVRSILRQILAPHLGCRAEQVPLISQPGAAPYLAGHPEIGITLSHETGLSLVAINLAGAVGVDLLYLPETPAWADEIDALANDYMGITIAGNNPNERQQNFAQAWTAHEAKLKCLSLPLSEWNKALAAALAPCQVTRLRLGKGLIGACARLGNHPFNHKRLGSNCRKPLPMPHANPNQSHSNSLVIAGS